MFPQSVYSQSQPSYTTQPIVHESCPIQPTLPEESNDEVKLVGARSGSYTKEEDLLLISAWLNTGQDPIDGRATHIRDDEATKNNGDSLDRPTGRKKEKEIRKRKGKDTESGSKFAEILQGFIDEKKKDWDRRFLSEQFKKDERGFPWKFYYSENK
ncbi:hypothetical protein GIB67_010352 [Kingdonia uniflora]|uniref:Uncharacterized protein n=1 Tax=Kingdonia uniflora TaxID=39325 RepID=A0A7J7MAK4_9MAGN|nr:hypothetical protein GIB67_010352 [Kingdonia uniflora]